MPITAWTQHVDFTQDQHDEVSVERAISLVREHDWDSVAEAYNARFDEKEDACPPGIGFNRDDGSVLHIYLSGEGTFTLHLGLVRRTRLLLIIPFRYTRNFETSGHSLDEALEAVEDFYEDVAADEA